MALPAAVCTIPGTITVPDGESGASVKVSVDLKALAAQSATFKDAEGYKKLGFLGGMAVPAVIRYGYGFVQGANAAAEELGK